MSTVPFCSHLLEVSGSWSLRVASDEPYFPRYTTSPSWVWAALWLSHNRMQCGFQDPSSISYSFSLCLLEWGLLGCSHLEPSCPAVRNPSHKERPCIRKKMQIKNKRLNSPCWKFRDFYFKKYVILSTFCSLWKYLSLFKEVISLLFALWLRNAFL